MRKERILLFLGFWIIILPYLGFPSSWKNILLTLSGFGIILISYLFHKEKERSDDGIKAFDNFRENDYNNIKEF